jgi:hypothetical protein
MSLVSLGQKFAISFAGRELLTALKEAAGI